MKRQQLGFFKSMVEMPVWEDVLGVGTVNAHFILLRGIFAEVFDVA